MEYIIFAAVILFYLYRFFTNLKKEQAEAEKRRSQPRPPEYKRTESSEPRTIEDVLTEVFREVETQTKPYARPEIPKTFEKKKVLHEKKKSADQTFKWQAPKPVAKKDPKPFLTTDYSPEEYSPEGSAEAFSPETYKETIEPEGAPSYLMDDYLKKQEITDAYLNVPAKPLSRIKFDLRDAVIASVILNRPEY